MKTPVEIMCCFFLVTVLSHCEQEASDSRRSSTAVTTANAEGEDATAVAADQDENAGDGSVAKEKISDSEGEAAANGSSIIMFKLSGSRSEAAQECRVTQRSGSEAVDIPCKLPAISTGLSLNHYVAQVTGLAPGPQEFEIQLFDEGGKSSLATLDVKVAVVANTIHTVSMEVKAMDATLSLTQEETETIAITEAMAELLNGGMSALPTDRREATLIIQKIGLEYLHNPEKAGVLKAPLMAQGRLTATCQLGARTFDCSEYVLNACAVDERSQCLSFLQLRTQNYSTRIGTKNAITFIAYEVGRQTIRVSLASTILITGFIESLLGIEELKVESQVEEETEFNLEFTPLALVENPLKTAVDKPHLIIYKGATGRFGPWWHLTGDVDEAGSLSVLAETTDGWVVQALPLVTGYKIEEGMETFEELFPQPINLSLFIRRNMSDIAFIRNGGSGSLHLMTSIFQQYDDSVTGISNIENWQDESKQTLTVQYEVKIAKKLETPPATFTTCSPNEVEKLLSPPRFAVDSSKFALIFDDKETFTGVDSSLLELMSPDVSIVNIDPRNTSLTASQSGTTELLVAFDGQLTSKWPVTIEHLPVQSTNLQVHPIQPNQQNEVRLKVGQQLNLRVLATCEKSRMSALNSQALRVEAPEGGIHITDSTAWTTLMTTKTGSFPIRATIMVDGQTQVENLTIIVEPL